MDYDTVKTLNAISTLTASIKEELILACLTLDEKLLKSNLQSHNQKLDSDLTIIKLQKEHDNLQTEIADLKSKLTVANQTIFDLANERDRLFRRITTLQKGKKKGK